MNLATLNRQAATGRRRAEALEPELAAVYAKALRRTARQAAERFSLLAPTRTLTADATNPTPPEWTPPDPDELLGDPLTPEEKAQAQRIHLRAVEEAVPAAVKSLPGISFDVASPFALPLLEKVGTKGINLGLSSRDVAVKVIGDAYTNGLSVPATAAELRTQIGGLSQTTAVMQARTDLVGLANGASVASVQALGDAAPASKVWLATEDERTRETHADADGQEVPLDQPFQVGDDQLMYPGDPDGSDAETLNCRCTVVYSDGAGQDVSSGVEEPGVAALEGRPVEDDPVGVASDALVQPVVLGRADGGPEVRDALQAINQVHGLPALNIDPIPVVANPDLPSQTGARLVSHREGSITFPDQIDVNPMGTSIELDFAHEVGHVLDYTILRGETSAVVQAAKETQAWKALRTLDSDHGEYLRRDREIFARAYAQWIAERSANTEMLDQVAASLKGANEFGLAHAQWETADFAPVRQAFDKLFADKGLTAEEPALEVPAFATVDEAVAWANTNLAPLVEITPKANPAALQQLFRGIQTVLAGQPAKIDAIKSVETRAAWNGRLLTSRKDGTTTFEVRASMLKSAGAAAKQVAKEQAIFEKAKAVKIVQAERAMNDTERPQVLRDMAARDLEKLRAAVRWSSVSDSDEPLAALAAHETGHALYQQIPGLKAAWKAAIADVPREDWFAVSAYASSLFGSGLAFDSASELFSEVLALKVTGRQLPAAILQALRTTLGDVALTASGGTMTIPPYNPEWFVPEEDQQPAASGVSPALALASGGLMDTSPSVTAAVTVTVDGPQPDTAAAVRWQGILTLEGVPTLDGRYFAPGAWRWRELPLSLMVQFETAEGHDGAVVGGNIDGIWKEPYPEGGADAVAVMGTGLISSDECGQRTAQLVADEMLRGVSVDYQVLEAMLRNPDTGELIDPATVDPEQMFMSDYQIAALDAEIGAATVCSFPAFAEATIGLVASGQMYAAFAIRVVDEDALTASVSAPLCPPAEWFDTAEPPGLMPLTVTPEGRVFGHLAPWNVCHVGLPGGCTTAPKSRSGYAYFHVGELDTADGARVSVGKLMVGKPGLGGKHANPALSRIAAVKHYDDNTAVGAYVRAVDGRHGIWVCGAVRPGIDAAGLQELRANPPSGDWRPVNGRLELIAGLSVPVPGFPVPRAEVSMVASADEIVVESLVLTAGPIEPSERVLRSLVAAGTMEAETTGLPAVRRPSPDDHPVVEMVPVRRPAPVR